MPPVVSSDPEGVYSSADDSQVESGDESSSADEDSDTDEFEDQGSSDEDEDLIERQQQDGESTDGSLEILDDVIKSYDSIPRSWKGTIKRTAAGKQKSSSGGSDRAALWMNTDDLSSDDEDEEGTGNRVGRVPNHWYDQYDHIGYNVHGSKVNKNGNLIDRALAVDTDRSKGAFSVHDPLNDRDITLTDRQLQLIRRIQGGAFAHPEFEANPDYVDYFSGSNKEVSGLNSARFDAKQRFLPNKWEKLQVRRLLDRLEKGTVTMDDLLGNTEKSTESSDLTFMLWKDSESDDQNLSKGPQHIAAPKQPPPGHLESYIPPDEYLPTETDVKSWNEMDVKDRPHGLLVPKKFPNLRSVGAYPHSVREAFERCLDLYLCPRVLKRRLNIDPESLVPSLPKANDLRPFPTVKCIEYKSPYQGTEPPMIRCVSPSPDGQFMASGGSDGYVRLWEVETGRLLTSWNLFHTISDYQSRSTTHANGASGTENDTLPIVCLQWNPNPRHHCLLAVSGNCAAIIATGTAGSADSEVTEALLGNALSGSSSSAVKWYGVASKDRASTNHGALRGPICVLATKSEVTSINWHKKGDYWVSVNAKAGASSVLIHQLSKARSQQPFKKAKGEAQHACFHPNKPFLFVASQQHVRVYHLLKTNMVKRLVSGCRWISSIDVHPTGDHLIVGSLDRKATWVDLDLSSTPYKTLRYHSGAIRSVNYHKRYPIMATASDDGVIHIFHSMVYADLMRNPLIVPVKVLRGHIVRQKLGVLATAFHPSAPWLFSGGADGRIFLYQDI